MTIIFYLGSILLANALVSHFGIVTQFGLTFPAGAYAIGATFTARDLMQRKYGKWNCWVWMLTASILTGLFAPKIAFASVSAFLFSEFIDWAVYTFSRGSFEKRVVLSNLIGTPFDSIVFVLLAFGPVWPAMIGQTVIKIATGILILATVKLVPVRHE